MEYTELCKISFDANHGAGEDMPVEWAAKGEKYSLPDCTYTYSGGMEFSGWKIKINDQLSGELMQPGEKITVTGDMELAANWGYNRPIWTLCYRSGMG